MDSKKSKKKTPEQRLAEFEEWKKSDEYKILQQIKEMKDNLPQILEITEDFIGKWEEFLDVVLQVGKVFKVKKISIKVIQQNQIRSAFFGGVNKRDEPFEIDFKELDFENKEHQKVCRHVKLTFIDFIKQSDNLDILDENRYQDFKKNKVVYKYKDFINFFKEHIKKGKGHEESENLLKIALQPFRELLEANFKLTIFETKHSTEETLQQNYFQYKALIETFCDKYYPCQNVLFRTSDEITCDPDIYTILKLINYKNWQEKWIEHFYIFPLLESYNKLRANMLKTYSLGMGFWYQPLKLNEVFLNDVKEMIDNQSKAEFLLGDCLSRYQTNFMYDTIKKILNEEFKLALEKDGERIIQHVLPAVIIFESMIHMRQIYDKKIDEIDENFFNFEETKLINFELKSCKNPDKELQDVIPEGFQQSFYVRQTLGSKKEILINDNDGDQLNDLGRFFIFYDYLPKETHEEFVNQSLELKRINRRILKDIKDFIILKGLIPNGQSYIKDRQTAINQMNLLKQKMENEEKENLKQQKPPKLWNNPNLKDQSLLYSVDIFSDHQDPQVHQLYNYIDYMTQQLTSFKREKWQTHLKLVLDSFNQFFLKVLRSSTSNLNISDSLLFYLNCRLIYHRTQMKMKKRERIDKLAMTNIKTVVNPFL